MESLASRLIRDFSLDEFRQEHQRFLPAKITSLGGDDGRHAFLGDVQLCLCLMVFITTTSGESDSGHLFRRQKAPPPAPMFCPVTHRAASLARNTAKSATSFGSPMRLNGEKTFSNCRNAPSPHAINVKLRRIPREKQNTKQ